MEKDPNAASQKAPNDEPSRSTDTAAAFTAPIFISEHENQSQHPHSSEAPASADKGLVVRSQYGDLVETDLRSSPGAVSDQHTSDDVEPSLQVLPLRATSASQLPLPEYNAASLQASIQQTMPQRNVSEVTTELWVAFVKRNEKVRYLRVEAADRRKAALERRKALKKRLLGKVRRSSLPDDETLSRAHSDPGMDARDINELLEEFDKTDDELEQAEEQLAREEHALINLAPKMTRAGGKTFTALRKYELDIRGNDSDSDGDANEGQSQMELDDFEVDLRAGLALRTEEEQLEDEIMRLGHERGRIMTRVVSGPTEDMAHVDADFLRLGEIDQLEERARARMNVLAAERDRVLEQEDAAFSPWITPFVGTPAESPRMLPRSRSAESLPSAGVMD